MAITASSKLNKVSYKSIPVQGQRVLVRVDFNVPFDKNGNIADDARLQAHLKVLRYLIDKKAKIILIAHLGRPKGQVNLKYSLKPIVKPLAHLVKVPVLFSDDCIGPKVYEAVAKLKAGEILLLENLRFHSEEEKNNSVFAKELASCADYFIQDAFGAVHRAHASTSQITNYLPSAAGPLLEKELTFLGKVKESPEQPFVAVLGGAKVSDKIKVVESLLEKVNKIFIGGAMAYTFLKAKGVEIGASRCEEDAIEFCKGVLSKAKEKDVEFLLPIDHIIVKDIENPKEAKIQPSEDIPADWKGVDIGPKTIELLKSKFDGIKTAFWNGPAGIFEVDEYSNGTIEIAKILAQQAKADATVIVGGGDSVAAVKKAGLADKMTYISTGGGASLEFLEGKELPGVTAIPNA